MSEPDLAAKLRAWTCRQQRLADPASEPEDAPRDIIGVYSSHPTAALSLLAQLKRVTSLL